jgi:hypothetical protein
MPRLLFSVVTILVLLLLACSPAEARGWRRAQRSAPAPQAKFADEGPAHVAPLRAAPVDPRAIYPKYYGGFHARALQDIGIPTGDRGIRGNGIYANPW